MIGRIVIRAAVLQLRCAVPSTSRAAGVAVCDLQCRHYASESKRRRKFVEKVIIKPTKSKKETVDLYADMNAREMATALSVDYATLVDSLVELDARNLDFVDKNVPLDKETLLKTAALYNFKPRFVLRVKKAGMSVTTNEKEKPLEEEKKSRALEYVRRPPVVTIMGHVDHGKTTLLDALRSSKIVEGEFGGITQHIGAFSVELKGSKKRVTFLDTPGHAAFATMRARGAQGADIVVLVVAADDGVKEQTIESIKYAQQAGVPIVVAVNKCDKPNADPMMAKRSLLAHNVVVEELGGDVQCVEISALQKRNLPALQEALLMQADIMDLRGTSQGAVEGTVVESFLSQGIGKVCTVIVQAGTLRKNAILVSGSAWCRVRSLSDDKGRQVTSAGPSQPVRVSGWKENLPSPGDRIVEATSTDEARKLATDVATQKMMEKAGEDWEEIDEQRKIERQEYLTNRQMLLDKGYRYGSTLRHVVHKKQRLTKSDGSEGKTRLDIIIRADVEGSLEAIQQVLDTYSCQDDCELRVVNTEVGPPVESDIELAKEAGAALYLFNVTPDARTREQAEAAGVRVEYFNVIYRLVEALKNDLSSRLPKKTEMNLVGEGHVLKEFLISDRARKRQPIAGVLVDWGAFHKNHIFKILRGAETVYEGKVESMKRDQEIVTTASTNTEVGLALENKNIRFKPDDTVEVYEEKQVTQTIDWHPPGF